MRFGWPMRLFLCAFVGDMLVRSVLTLTPFDSRWSKELHVDLFPKQLPTPAEFDQIDAGKHPEGYTTRSSRLAASFEAIGPYLNPLPSAKTQAELVDGAAVGKYAVTWIASRLKFLGILIGVDQTWPMFAPYVADDESIARIRLVYADGTSDIWHPVNDPVDITNYSHWFEEKQIDFAAKLRGDQDVQVGYCRWLARKFANRPETSRLVRIEIFTIYYKYPPPGADSAELLRAQIGPPPDQQSAPTWIYDVATGTGKQIQN